jgi:hypothetical protein
MIGGMYGQPGVIGIASTRRNPALSQFRDTQGYDVQVGKSILKAASLEMKQ